MSVQTVFSPSPRYKTHILIGVALLTAIFVLPLVFLALIPELGWVYLLIFVVVNALWLVPTVILIPAYCRTIQYEFGERDLLVRRGLLTRSESMVPYRMVTNVEAKRGPIARALGIGSLKVHTAGYSQQTQSEASLNGLANWAEVQQHLLMLIHEHRAEDTGQVVGVAGSGPAGNEVSVLLGEILAEIRALRVERP